MSFCTAATAADISKAAPEKVAKKHQHKQTEKVVEAAAKTN